MKDASHQEKREKMATFLDEGMVLLQLDSRLEEVEVPDYLRGDPKLRLNISGRFGLPLELDDWGVRATLTFRGTPYDCSIPWHAIYIIISHTSGEPQLFPDDIPEEFVADALGTTYQDEDGSSKEDSQQGRPAHLRLVAEEAKAEGATVQMLEPAPVPAPVPEPEPEPELAPQPAPAPVAVPESDDSTDDPDTDPPSGNSGKRRHLSVVK